MSIQKADLEGKKVLFISYFFPPIESTGVPGAMRSIKFIRNLSNGIIHVIAPSEHILHSQSALSHISLPIKNETLHRIRPWDIFKQLLALRSHFKKNNTVNNDQIEAEPSPQKAVFKASNESEVSINKIQLFKDFIYNLCYFPDQAGPWILPATRYGKKLVKEHDIDVIFATGSPWSSLITGYLISKASNTPLIVDFRDPWINNPFHVSKGNTLDKWAIKLERKIVTHASIVSLNTEPLKSEFLERYPNIDSEKFIVLPNGFDLIDFENIDLNHTKTNTDTITLCHAGFLYGLRDPATLLNAIEQANKETNNQNKKIIFKQIGDVQLSYDICERYKDMIADGSFIIEPPMSYTDCLQELAKSDWVINIQPATKSQVPSKLYDYLAINRPIINITPEDGALGQLVKKHNLGELFDFSEEQKLSYFLLDIANQEEHHFTGYKARDEFDYKIIATKLAKHINQLN